MKTNITLSIDSDLVAEARLKGIKFSQIINSYLRTYLGLPEQSDDIDIKNLDSDIEKAQANLLKLNDQKQEVLRQIKKGDLIIC